VLLQFKISESKVDVDEFIEPTEHMSVHELWKYFETSGISFVPGNDNLNVQILRRKTEICELTDEMIHCE
jgi:hypothetical protein